MATSRRPRFQGVINRIRLVGVELEGGWDAIPPGETVEKDGSVKFPQQQQVSVEYDNAASDRALVELIRRRAASGEPSQRVRPPQREQTTIPAPKIKGEIVSKPLPPDPEVIETWIQKCHPKYVNETCGLHVHMSFNYRHNYSRLMTPDYTMHMVKAVREFASAEGLPKDHPQWCRLNPMHPWTQQHCLHKYLGEAQVNVPSKDFHSRGKPYSRYTFVNYCDKQHGTVEVRGLSMFDNPAQSARGVFAVLVATNLFLSKLRERERPIRGTVQERDSPEVQYGAFNNY